MTKIFIDPLAYKYVPAFTKAVIELNRVLREAAKDGVKPIILIHEDDDLYGDDVQVVEVSMALSQRIILTK